jgi:hypothetical protein
MLLEVEEEDYEVNVQRHSAHTVKTGDYALQVEKGQVSIGAASKMEVYSESVVRVVGERQLELVSNSAIVLRAGASTIVLNDKGVFIDGPSVQINSGAPVVHSALGEITFASVPVPELESAKARRPVSPAAADDSKSGFASSAKAAKQTPAQPSGNGASKGTTIAGERTRG